MSQPPAHDLAAFWAGFDKYIHTFSHATEARDEMRRLITLHPGDPLSLNRPAKQWSKVVGVLCLTETAIPLDLDGGYDHVAPGEVALIGGTPIRRVVSFVTRQLPTLYPDLGFKGNFLPLFTADQVEQALLSGHRWRYTGYEENLYKEWRRINADG